jgi:hypothetical protein
LRTREDANTVKVTISGLKQLLGVDIKTIRRCLKALVTKGFIFYEKDVWDDGFNYPKKMYSFPTTFPGFDLKTIFVRKGAKQKFRIASRNKAVGKGRCAFVVSKSTCPITTTLVDCPLKKRTCNLSEKGKDTNVSSPSPERITETPPPRTPSVGAGVSAKRTRFAGVNFHHDGLQALILDFLRSYKLERQVGYVSRFFNKRCDQLSQFKTLKDREEFAQELFDDFNEFYQSVGKRRNVLGHLFWYLQFYAENFCPSDFFNSPQYLEAFRREQDRYNDKVVIKTVKNRMPQGPDLDDVEAYRRATVGG